MMKGYHWETEYDGYGGTIFERHYFLMRENRLGNDVIGKIIWKRIWGVYKADINGQLKNFKSLSGAKNFVETVAGVRKSRTKKADTESTNDFGMEWNLK